MRKYLPASRSSSFFVDSNCKTNEWRFESLLITKMFTSFFFANSFDWIKLTIISFKMRLFPLPVSANQIELKCYCMKFMLWSFGSLLLWFSSSIKWESILTRESTNHSQKWFIIQKRVHCAIVNHFEDSILLCVQLLFFLVENDRGYVYIIMNSDEIQSNTFFSGQNLFEFCKFTWGKENCNGNYAKTYSFSLAHSQSTRCYGARTKISQVAWINNIIEQSTFTCIINGLISFNKFRDIYMTSDGDRWFCIECISLSRWYFSSEIEEITWIDEFVKKEFKLFWWILCGEITAVRKHV